jgi:hypothetical protein
VGRKASAKIKNGTGIKNGIQTNEYILLADRAFDKDFEKMTDDYASGGVNGDVSGFCTSTSLSVTRFLVSALRLRSV